MSEKSENSFANITFSPFLPQISNGFWQKYSKQKLDAGLKEAPIEICGFYGSNVIPNSSPILQLDHASFDRNQTYHNLLRINGIIISKNTFEVFRDCDKNKILQNYGNIVKLLSTDIGLDQIANDPKLLVQFFILTYPDLKKHKFHYWFAFPAIFNYDLKLKTNFEEPSEEINHLLSNLSDQLTSCLSHGFFIISNGSAKVLKEIDSLEDQNPTFAFLDPSSIEKHPGWVLRNFTAFIVAKLKLKSNSELNFLSIKRQKNDLVGKFFRTTVQYKDNDSLKMVGWARRGDGKLGPLSVDLAASMDPIRLADSAVDFNLKLMKWRLFPEFDLEKMHGLKCLLLGAGTLGCNVARCLMGWGVRKIHFIDNGVVSYSNLVRQSLFTFKDATDGKKKAEAASDALKQIFPTMETQFDFLSVPMPGHVISPSSRQTVADEFSTLVKRVEDADVIFLLMDTRESRWLPTVMGACYNKIVINAALGFDSYLVMRHGHGFGCYFCTDVVAPGDSTRDRSLDQQCTVTRPGVSMIASGLAAELLTSFVHNSNSLGKTPHTIRGFMGTCELITPSFAPFDRCTACSSKVVEEFRQEGFSFVEKVSNDPGYLEKLSGLDELKCGSEGIVELSDDEDP